MIKIFQMGFKPLTNIHNPDIGIVQLFFRGFTPLYGKGYVRPAGKNKGNGKEFVKMGRAGVCDNTMIQSASCD